MKPKKKHKKTGTKKQSSYRKKTSRYLKRPQVVDRKGNIYTKKLPFYLNGHLWLYLLFALILLFGEMKLMTANLQLEISQEELNKIKKEEKKKEKELDNKPLFKGKEVEVGSSGKSEKLTLQVKGIEELREIKDGKYLTYKSDSGKYILVDVTINNEGEKSTLINSSYFKLVQGEKEYEPTRLSNLSEQYITYQNLNPDISTKGKLVFEVSKDLNLEDTKLFFSSTDEFKEVVVFNLQEK